jgi:asparagine synthase (glutamine-hydrolysing)
MPGIVGILSKIPDRETPARLQRMLQSMLHEQFYSSGCYSNEDLGIAVGWTSHPKSFTTGLPFWNETREVCLIIAGEEFSDQADIDGLKGRGHCFSETDGSYLVHQYEEKGIDFLRQLNGWFSGLLIDLRRKQAALFNDRYGLRRIYVHENESGLYFASEAKALLKALPHLRTLDERGLGELIGCGCVLQNRTIFSGISLLPGGSRWTFNPGRPLQKQFYFAADEWERQPRLSSADYYERLRTIFPRVLKRYFRGSQPIGMSLTGGLDGRMIMAWAPSAPGELPCYTFGGSYRECTDVVAARRVAQVCRQPHQVIPVNGDFIGDFPKLVERSIYLSDGAMDVTGSVELYSNKVAREIAPVRMTGNYGSEILRRNVAFKPRTLNETLFAPDFMKQVRKAAVTYEAEKRCRRLSFIAFKQVPWHHCSRLAVEQSQLTMRAPFLDNDLLELTYQAPPDVAASREPSLRLIADGNPSLSRIPTDRGVLHGPLPVASRVNHAYQEFTFRAEYAYDYGMPQWLAKIDHAFAPFHLEKLFLGRHKFYHFRVWYRDKLAAYLKEMLLDPRTRSRPYLQGIQLDRMVNSHIAGTHNYTVEIHQALGCELIHRTLLEQ